MKKRIIFLLLIFILTLGCYSKESNMDKYENQFKSIEQVLTNENNIDKEIELLKKDLVTKEEMILLEKICVIYEFKLYRKPISIENSNENKDYLFYLKKTIDKGTKNPLIYFFYGNILSKMNQYSEASKNYDKSIDLGIFELWTRIAENKEFVIYYNLATTYEMAKLLDKSELYWKKYLGVTQTDILSYFGIADFYNTEMNDVDKAIDYIETGIKISNKSTSTTTLSSVYNVLGKLKEKKSLKEEAIIAYEIAIKLDNNNEKAKKNLEKLRNE